MQPMIQPKKNSENYRVLDNELLQFVERIELLNSDKKENYEARNGVFSDAKGRGYNTKALRKIIALREQTPDAISEEETFVQMYKDALGM